MKPKVPRRQETLVRADNTVVVSAYRDDLRYDLPDELGRAVAPGHPALRGAGRACGRGDVRVPRQVLPGAIHRRISAGHPGFPRDGAIQRIIDASTGSGAWYYWQGSWTRAITPTGRFHIYWRYSNGWQPGPLGSMYRPNYFSGGYAVHGMTSVPASPARHGCVWMTVPTMDRMWSSLWIGMPIAIYSS